MSTLSKASNQWATRPADERFSNLEALRQATMIRRRASRNAEVPKGDLLVRATAEGDLELVGRAGVPAKLSNWSLRQLSGLAGAPGGYMGDLPAELAAKCLNHGLTERYTSQDEGLEKSKLLLTNGETGPMRLRALTSTGYARIWDHEVVERLQSLPGNWTNPMAYKWNAAANRPDWGGEMERAGLYSGDRDMFCFLIDDSRRINDGTNGSASRGFFVWNSEVGSKSFGIQTFMYRHVCGNNLVWGASNVVTRKIRHVGKAPERAFEMLGGLLREYADSSAAEDEANILRAQTTILGETKEEVVAKVADLAGTTRKLASAAWDTASQWTEVDGAPTTAWGMVNGITRYAQMSPWAEDRVDVDAVAGRLMVKVLS